MNITVKQLRKLVMEAVEAELKEQMDEYWSSSYSTGGSGGNRHGDSTDEERPERAYRPESPADREEGLRREEEHYRYHDRGTETYANESRKRKGLTLEALRKMVRAAIKENVFEQGAAAAPPPPPAPPAMDANAAAAAPAAPVAAAPAAAPAAPITPAAAPVPAAAPAAAPAPVQEAVRRIVRETVRKRLMEKEEKWMQKAGEEMEKKGTKGALHRALGKKEGSKLSKSELESKKSSLQKKGEGDKKLSAEERKMLRRVIFALNAMKAKKD